MTLNIHNGNCLDVLKHIPDKSIDLIICDLPYGITKCYWDKKIDLDLLWIQLLRVAKPNTPYFFFCKMKFAVELINSNTKMFRYEIIWDKDRLTNPLTSTLGFANSHELILVFYKKKPVYRIKDYHTKKDQVSTSKSFSPVTGTFNYSGPHGAYEPKLPLSIIKCPFTNTKVLRSTQKPVQLLETIIKYYSNEKDVVLDPTMGSGSTGIAALNLNRNFIGIEMDTECFKIAENRLQNL